MAYRGENSAPIGLHYGATRGVDPALIALSSTAAANQIAASYDGGLSWTQAVAPSTAGTNWQGVAYSPALGYAIAIAANGLTAQSLEGLTWVTLGGSTLINGNWRRLIWTEQNGGRFVTVGLAGGGVGLRASNSPDGLTWTTRATPAGPSSTAWIHLAELASGRIIAGGSGAFAQPFIFSDDGGDTWAYCAALPLGALDNSQKFQQAPGSLFTYFGSAFGTAPPFRDYFTSDGGATIGDTTMGTGELINPPVAGGTTCLAINDAGVIIRGDPLGLRLSDTARVLSNTPPDKYDTVAAGGAFNSVDDMLWVPEFGEFVGVNNTGGLTCVRSATGGAGTWVSAVGLAVGNFLHLRACHFGA